MSLIDYMDNKVPSLLEETCANTSTDYFLF